LTECAPVEPLLGRGDLLRLENVELHHVFGRLELAHAQVLACLVRIAEVIGELEFLEEGAQIGTLEHLKIGARELDLAEVRDVVSRELLQEGRIVALDFARNDDQRRAPFVLVGVFDGLVEGLVGGGICLLRRVASRGRRGIAKSRLRQRQRCARDQDRAERKLRHPDGGVIAHCKYSL
jgi:hypothetical protein